MDKAQKDSLKSWLEILGVFIGAYLIMDSSWLDRLQDFSKEQCIVHINDQNAEYVILGKNKDYYFLGILGNNEIKMVSQDQNFSQKAYINRFYKRALCPLNIKSFPIVEKAFIGGIRTQRMIEDLTKKSH